MNYKLIALADHLSLSYLIWEDEILYNVSLTEFNDLEGCNYESVEDIPKNNKAFLAYLKEYSSNFSDEVEVIDNDYYTFDKEEYLILTDDEANDKWDEYMENYIDDCILYQLPENYRNYFDREAFKSDCGVDGRGHSLASYDGEEIKVITEEDTYFIYRTN